MICSFRVARPCKHLKTPMPVRYWKKWNFRQYGHMKGTARTKLRHGECQKGEDKKWRVSEMDRVRREKMQVYEKVGKSGTLCFSSVLWLPIFETSATALCGTYWCMYFMFKASGWGTSVAFESEQPGGKHSTDILSRSCMPCASTQWVSTAIVAERMKVLVKVVTMNVRLLRLSRISSVQGHKWVFIYTCSTQLMFHPVDVP